MHDIYIKFSDGKTDRYTIEDVFFDAELKSIKEDNNVVFAVIDGDLLKEVI